MNKKKNRNEKGFTLIELIMIIVILGILAAVAIPKYVDMTERAEKRTVRAITGQLMAAAHTAFAKSVITDTSGRGTYPDDATALVSAAEVTGVTLSPSGNNITALINNVTYTWTYSHVDPATDGTTSGWAKVTDGVTIP